MWSILLLALVATAQDKPGKKDKSKNKAQTEEVAEEEKPLDLGAIEDERAEEKVREEEAEEEAKEAAEPQLSDAEMQELQQRLKDLQNRLDELSAGRAGDPAREEARQQALEDRLELIRKRTERNQNTDEGRSTFDAYDKFDRAMEERLLADTSGDAPNLDGFVVRGFRPGTMHVIGTKSEFQLNGYVQGSLWMDFNTSLGEFYSAYYIPYGTRLDDIYPALGFEARQSRVRLMSWTDLDKLQISTHIEFDFFGAGGEQIFNSWGLRLRHAYARIGPVGIGQYWSLFSALSALPNSVDFNAPLGTSANRAPQIRVQGPISKKVTLGVSFENPHLTGIDQNLDTFAVAGYGLRDFIPDVVVDMYYADDVVGLKLAALGRYFILDDQDVTHRSGGFGAHFAGRLKMGKRDYLLWAAIGGLGIGRYIEGGYDLGAYYDSLSGTLLPIWQVSGTVAWQHDWTDELEMIISGAHVQTFDIPNDGALEMASQARITFMYDFNARSSFGIEYSWGRDQNFAGEWGMAMRISSMARIVF